jgi:hypothetical protein
VIGHDLGDAGELNDDIDQFVGFNALGRKFHNQDGAVIGWKEKIVKDEISHAVGDQAILVSINALEDVGVAANDQ